MDAIREVFKVDIVAWLFTLFVILSAALAVAKILEQFSILIGKPVSWIKRRNNDHQLIIDTANNLKALQEKQSIDVEQSIRHDQRIRDDLSSFMSEMRSVVESLMDQMTQYSENRVHDREQSREIQRQLNERSDDRDKKIEALMLGNMELLGDKIDQRFSRYVALGGIPENEVEEFDGIFAAYKALNGNHKREEKYKYVKNHMKVIPVESKLKIDE